MPPAASAVTPAGGLLFVFYLSNSGIQDESIIMGGGGSSNRGSEVRNTGGTAASCAGEAGNIRKWQAEMTRIMNLILALQRDIAALERLKASKEVELSNKQLMDRMMKVRLDEMRTALRKGIERLMMERKIDVVIPNEKIDRYSHLSYNGNYVLELDIAPTRPSTPPPPPAPSLTPSVPANAIKYGDRIMIKAMATRWAGHDLYLSPCGRLQGGCGVDVSLRTNADYASYGGVESKLREWVILPLNNKPSGTPIRYGDIVRIKATASKWQGADGFLSPCGGAGGGCGINVSLRENSSYMAYKGDSSNLRDWRIVGGENGKVILYDDLVEIKGMASGFAGHDLYLSPCGMSPSPNNCGVNVTLRPDSEFTKHEPNSMLRKWKIMRLA